jgi:hypothetical protein
MNIHGEDYLDDDSGIIEISASNSYVGGDNLREMIYSVLLETCNIPQEADYFYSQMTEERYKKIERFCSGNFTAQKIYDGIQKYLIPDVHVQNLYDLEC